MDSAETKTSGGRHQGCWRRHPACIQHGRHQGIKTLRHLPVVTTGNWFYQANGSGIYGSYTQTEKPGMWHPARAVIFQHTEVSPACHCDYSVSELVLDHPCQLDWHWLMERAAVPTGKTHSNLTASCQLFDVSWSHNEKKTHTGRTSPRIKRSNPTLNSTWHLGTSEQC